MPRSRAALLLALSLAPLPAAAAADDRSDGKAPQPPAAVDGYGPWRFGMSREEVAAVAAHAPYSPVASTGGLETANGEFMGRPTPVSFAFGPRGLNHIQIWGYAGQDFAAAAAAFHTAYRHLLQRFGSLHADGRPLPDDLTPERLNALIPETFRAGSGDRAFEELQRRGSLQAQIQRLHLHPQRAPEDAEVYASLLHSPQLGMYWTFVYYKRP